MFLYSSPISLHIAPPTLNHERKAIASSPFAQIFIPSVAAFLFKERKGVLKKKLSANPLKFESSDSYTPHA